MASSISSIANSLRFTGLATGLDTDSMVTALMQADKAKLSKLTQRKTTLQWQMDDYRSMTNLLRGFSDQYFNLTNPTNNFRSASAFAAYNVTAGNPSVATAKVNASAVSTTHTIAVQQLAEAAKIDGLSSITASVAGSANISNFALQGKKINVTLDGTTKTIDLQDYANGDMTDLTSKLEASLNTAFGSGKFNVTANGSNISIDTTLPGSTFSIAEAPNNFVYSLGFINGRQNFITGTDVNLDYLKTSGGKFNISVDGGTAQEITVNPTDNMTDLVTQLNNALGSNATATFDGKKLSLTTTTGKSIKLTSGSANNILDKLGFANGANVNAVGSTDIDLTGNEKGKTFTVNINGADTTVTIDKDYANLSDLKDYLNNSSSLNGKGVTVDVDTTGKRLIFKSSQKLIFKNGPQDSLTSLGFSSTDNKSNRISLSASLDSIKNNFGNPMTIASPTDNVSFVINGQTVDLKKDYAHATLNDVITAVNTSAAGVELKYDSLHDKFTMASKTTGSISNIQITDSSSGIFNAIGITGGVKTDGTDAKFRLDGVEGMVRDSNTFTVDGVTYTLTGKSADYSVDATIGIQADVDGLFNKIKGFIDKYNDIIGQINGKLTEDRYKDYRPLTDEEKSAMKDSDVTLWETKAKSGLLRDDEILSNAVMNMRTALYDSIYTTSGDDSSKLSYNLSSIGITTGSYEDKGKLVINEAKLKDAIRNSPDKVANLFTQESDVSYTDSIENSAKRKERYNEEGLAQRLYDVLQDNIRTTRNKAGYKGLLIEKAGVQDDTSEYVNMITKDINDTDSRIDELNLQIINKENSYYQKFAKLEEAISQMNSQSSWLTAQLGK